MAEGPGRSCPASYGYGAGALAGPAALRTDTLWVAGGLYGNVEALRALLERYAADAGDKALVFNGDFHWFDAAAEDFNAVNRAVLGHRATRGNVETELADPQPGAGCGCVYPDWVGDAEVQRSNRILERLRLAAAPQALGTLARLPMHLVAKVGGERVGVVHGDASSLAGWGFAQEVLATPQGVAAAQKAFQAAGVRVFASSHTCLPVLKEFAGGRAVVNNGAAGMPNFRGTRYGLATRVSVRPDRHALYATQCGPLHVEAHAIDYDHAAWLRRFQQTWPEGSDAWLSYAQRILQGPGYEFALARRAA